MKPKPYSITELAHLRDFIINRISNLIEENYYYKKDMDKLPIPSYVLVETSLYKNLTDKQLEALRKSIISHLSLKY